MMNPFNRHARAGVLPASLVLVLAGCAGHGSYTKQHLDESQDKLAQLKSGTEWQMAQQQFLAGELDKAHKTIDKSLALNDKVPKSYVLKGRILMEKGQLEGARICFLEAEKLESTNVDAQYYLGILHERFNEPLEAYERYTKACELDSTNAQYVIAAAEMLVQMGRVDEAEGFLNVKRSNFEYNAAIRQSLGQIAMLRGDAKTARTMYQEARLLSPDDLHILEDLIRAETADGQFAEAEVNIRKLMESDQYSTRRDLKHVHAKCLLASNRPVEARAILVELTSDDEGARDIEAWVDLGNTSYILKDRIRLRNVAARLTAIAPERHEGYLFRGIGQMLAGETQSALASFNESLARTKTDATPYILKGLMLQDLGRTEEAKQSYADAVQIDPHGPGERALRALGGQGIASGDTQP